MSDASDPDARRANRAEHLRAAEARLDLLVLPGAKSTEDNVAPFMRKCDAVAPFMRKCDAAAATMRNRRADHQWSAVRCRRDNAKSSRRSCELYDAAARQCDVAAATMRCRRGDNAMPPRQPCEVDAQNAKCDAAAASRRQMRNRRAHHRWIEAQSRTQAKPPGALGTLERWAATLCAAQRTLRPVVADPAALIFVGDHGAKLADASLSPYPAHVTASIFRALAAGTRWSCAAVFGQANDVRLVVGGGVEHGIAATTRDRGDDAATALIVRRSSGQNTGRRRRHCSGRLRRPRRRRVRRSRAPQGRAGDARLSARGRHDCGAA